MGFCLEPTCVSWCRCVSAAWVSKRSRRGLFQSAERASQMGRAQGRLRFWTWCWHTHAHLVRTLRSHVAAWLNCAIRASSRFAPRRRTPSTSTGSPCWSTSAGAWCGMLVASGSPAGWGVAALAQAALGGKTRIRHRESKCIHKWCFGRSRSPSFCMKRT